MDQQQTKEERRQASYKFRGIIQQRRNERQERVVSLRKEQREKKINALRHRDLPPLPIPELNNPDRSVVSYNSEVIRRFIIQVQESNNNEAEDDGPFPKWTTSSDVIFGIGELLKQDISGVFAEVFCGRGFLSPILMTFAYKKRVYCDESKRIALAEVLVKLTPKYVNVILNTNHGLAVTLLLSFLIPRRTCSLCWALDALRKIAKVATPPILQQGLLHSLNFVLSHKVNNKVLYRVALLLEVICRPKSLAKETLEAFPTSPPLSLLKIHSQIVCLVHKLLLEPSSYNEVLRTALELTSDLLENLEEIPSSSDRARFFFSPNFSKSHPVLVRLVELVSFPSEIANVALHILSDLTFDSSRCDELGNDEYFDGLLQANFLGRFVICLERAENYASLPNVECLTLLGRLMAQGETETRLTIQQSSIMKYILNCVQSSNANIATEAIWSVGIIAENIFEEDMFDFVENYDVVRTLCDLFRLPQDADILLWTLQALLTFFKCSSESTMKYLAHATERCGGFEKIENLSLNHPKERIRNEAEELSEILAELNNSDSDTTYADSLEDAEPNPTTCSSSDLSHHRRSTSNNPASSSSPPPTVPDTSLAITLPEANVVLTSVHVDEFDFYA